MFNAIDIPTLALAAATFLIALSRSGQMEAADDAAVAAAQTGRLLKSHGGGGANGIDVARPLDEALLAHDDPDAVLDSIISFAVLLMWFRQLRSLSLMSSAMSDLVQMLAAMIIDVAKFMLLFAVVLFAFAASMSHLVDEQMTASAGPECAGLMMRLSNVMSSVELLFEGALLGDVLDPLMCMRQSTTGIRQTMGTALLLLFMIISILMLLNMIIAIMGQTFSEHHAQATESSALYFARFVQDWEDHTQQPPLFNLFALPWYAVIGVYRLGGLMLSCLWHGPLSRIVRIVARHAPHGGAVLLQEEEAAQAEDASQSASPSAATALETAYRGYGRGSVRDPPSARGGHAQDGDGSAETELTTLEDMRHAIAKTLERSFGSWDSTAALIETATTTLAADVHDVHTTLDALSESLKIDHRQRIRKEASTARLALGLPQSAPPPQPRARTEAVAQDEPQLSPEGEAPSSEALASAMAPVARPPPRWPPATEFQA